MHLVIFVCNCVTLHYALWTLTDLVQQLEALKVDEVIDRVGPVMLQWIPSMLPYLDYCANLVTAKYVMEEKKHNPAVVDFLQRCLDSEFSRKIELWTFLGWFPLSLQTLQLNAYSGLASFALPLCAKCSFQLFVNT